MYVANTLQGLGAIKLPKYIETKNTKIVQYALDTTKEQLKSIGMDDIWNSDGDIFGAIEGKLQKVGEQTAKKGIEEYTPVLIGAGIGIALVGGIIGYYIGKN